MKIYVEGSLDKMSDDNFLSWDKKARANYNGRPWKDPRIEPDMDDSLDKHVAYMNRHQAMGPESHVQHFMDVYGVGKETAQLAYNFRNLPEHDTEEGYMLAAQIEDSIERNGDPTEILYDVYPDFSWTKDEAEFNANMNDAFAKIGSSKRF